MTKIIQVGDIVEWSEPSMFQGKPNLQKKAIVKELRQRDGNLEAFVREKTGLQLQYWISADKFTLDTRAK